MPNTAVRTLLSTVAAVALLVGLVTLAPLRAQRTTTVSDSPNTPFKLVTFEREGRSRIGLLLSERVLDALDANAELVRQTNLPALAMPGDMRELIEQYRQVAPRLYQIANYFKVVQLDRVALAFPLDSLSIKAPIKYPWNLLAAAVNYKSHAMEMGTATAPDPTTEDPLFFAKSPRSCIIDPGAPFYITPGRNIDWEGELAIIVGQPARNVTLDRAHDYVFGYSIVHDISDRGGTGRRVTTMIPGPNWFHMKSAEGAAPFGPAIVPKEFLPNFGNLRIVTRVNDVIKQDGNSKNLIYDEAHILRYLTSRLTLHAGDVIATGTPDGVGVARNPQEFLKPGDEVRIEIEGIGTLSTPMKAAPRQ